MTDSHPNLPPGSDPMRTLLAAMTRSKIIKMRQLFLLAVAATFLSAAAKPETLQYALRFGATPTSPIGPPVPCAVPTPGHTLCPYIEPDYVPNYGKVVPQAIQQCGASFVRFEPLTEGAERALFEVASGRAAQVVVCIKQHVPQGNIDAPPEGSHL